MSNPSQGAHSPRARGDVVGVSAGVDTEEGSSGAREGEICRAGVGVGTEVDISARDGVVTGVGMYTSGVRVGHVGVETNREPMTMPTTQETRARSTPPMAMKTGLLVFTSIPLYVNFSEVTLLAR